MTSGPPTPLLDTVDTPADLRRLARKDLRQLADELRVDHLGAQLVGELAKALTIELAKDRRSADGIEQRGLEGHEPRLHPRSAPVDERRGDHCLRNS